jgi:hypothetical protein
MCSPAERSSRAGCPPSGEPPCRAAPPPEQANSLRLHACDEGVLTEGWGADVPLKEQRRVCPRGMYRVADLTPRCFRMRATLTEAAPASCSRATTRFSVAPVSMMSSTCTTSAEPHHAKPLTCCQPDMQQFQTMNRYPVHERLLSALPLTAGTGAAPMMPCALPAHHQHVPP